MEMPKGNIPNTLSDTNLLKQLTEFSSSTNISEGIKHLIE